MLAGEICKLAGVMSACFKSVLASSWSSYVFKWRVGLCKKDKAQKSGGRTHNRHYTEQQYTTVVIGYIYCTECAGKQVDSRRCVLYNDHYRCSYAAINYVRNSDS